MLVAGPNLTTDRILRIDELRPAEVLRFSNATVGPGGKGVNVLRLAREMGFPATLVALAPGRTGGAVVGLLGDEGLAVVPVTTRGEVRAASIVIEGSGRVTVLNEPGPPVSPAEWTAYEHAMGEHLPGQTFLVCIGSAPPGTPPDAYARLVRMARDRGARSVVDASGPKLEAALEAGPDIVTPNVAEVEGMLRGAAGLPVEEAGSGLRERAAEAGAELIARGAGMAVVTVGRAGAAVVTASDRWGLEAPPVEVRNPIGAGDALVSGLVGCLERGDDLRSALSMALGCAGASVETEVPGLVHRRRVESLAAQVGWIRD
ncbi:MAG: 1-phosphofructokinase family hexose kinase [Actinomycetota bacterium]